ncbi:hypothetical protein COCON_G00058890 [Conger conger]|uniref:Uncharacterized protein n=1 Tax=Conger conger TaxID=82655 RepID=A0A9Q1I3E1_CONCO|nr:hypothetical protein COCON_G00058890 [Conger conger]
MDVLRRSGCGLGDAALSSGRTLHNPSETRWARLSAGRPTGSFREYRPNLTSLLVQPISASLANELLSSPPREGAAGLSLHLPIQCDAPPSPGYTPHGRDLYSARVNHPSRLTRPLFNLIRAESRVTFPRERKTVVLSIGTRAAYRTVYNVVGFLKGATNPDRYVLVGSRHDGWRHGDGAEWSGGLGIMTQIIGALTGRARKGWQPDRTAVFCSWGGSAFGNIGSVEWGGENGVVLQSRAVAYVSLHRPIRSRGPLRPTASPPCYSWPLTSTSYLELQLSSEPCAGVSTPCERELWNQL